MSLFTLREFWQSSPDAEGLYDSWSMALFPTSALPPPGEALAPAPPKGAAAGKPLESPLLITASLQGLIRVHKVVSKGQATSDDLLLEHPLDAPVLGIAVGGFLPSLPNPTALAVLHPRELVLYQLLQQHDGIVLHKQGSSLLERNAANMVAGPFGGCYDKDLVLVQSTDGLWTVFEGTTVACSVEIPTVVLPGPLLYCRKTDTLVTASCGGTVEAYKYRSIAYSKKTAVTPDWSIDLGDTVLELHLAKFSKGLGATQSEIVALTDHGVFCLKESGGSVRWQTRLNYIPATCLPYQARATAPTGGTGGVDNLLIASTDGNLYIYDGNKLAWAVRTPVVPVRIVVSSWNSVRGLIGLLGPEGGLSLNFLGTDPALLHAPDEAAPEGRDLDYAAMEHELKSLQDSIRSAATAATGASAKSHQSAGPRKGVELSLSFGGVTWTSTEGAPAQSVEVFVDAVNLGSGDANEATVSLSAPMLFAVEPRAGVSLGTLGPGQKGRAEFVISRRMDRELPVPVDMKMSASVGWMEAPIGVGSVADAPRQSGLEAPVPLSLALGVIAPIKNNGYKITFASSGDPVSLLDLFNDLMSDDSARRGGTTLGQANVVSLATPSGVDVSVVAAKASSKVRIQSSSFEALALVAQETVRRLEGRGFTVTYVEALPLQEYFAAVDTHVEARGRAAALFQELDKGAAQYRAVQQRLLSRYKEKSPTDMSSLEALLELTYNGLLTTSERLEEAEMAVRKTGEVLAGGTALMNLLLRTMCALDADNSRALENWFSPNAVSGDYAAKDPLSAGWPEMMEHSLSVALKTVLSNNTAPVGHLGVKSAIVGLGSGGVGSEKPELVKDTGRLKKSIAQLCDRLVKGVRFMP